MRRRVFILILALVVALSLAAGVMRARAATTGAAEKPTIKVIVVLKHGASANAVAGKLAARDSSGVVRYHIIPAFSATVSRSTLAALRADDSVSVFMDRRIPAPKIPTGAEGVTDHEEARARRRLRRRALESEALQLTHAQDAWNIKVNGQQVMGQGVRVGMTDTGTDPVHPDLGPAIEAYRDFTGAGLRDNDGHGTATSSCVAAQGLPVYNPYTGTTMKVAGMAPKAKVLMAKVGDSNGGYDSQFIRGIQWLVDEKVDIISDSWGGFALPPDGNDPVSMTVKAAVSSGISFVVSAFNEGPGQGTLGSPSDVKGALTVGASTGAREFAQTEFMTSGDAYKGDQVITWSSRGPNSLGDSKPDIMAFGAYGWALAPTQTDDYGDVGIQEFGGTSMAAPVAAGDLALAECAWKLAHPGKSLPAPAYWKKLIASTAADLGYPALDQSSGLINAKAAVKAVLKQGKSMLVGVNGQNAASWSARVTGGAKATTKIVVRNTGNAKEKISVSPTVYVTNASRTITKSVTLTGPDYIDNEDVTIPAGTDFVQMTVTWPSGPNVSIRTAVYDSDGNFLTYAPTYGGYGHLSQCQVSLLGPKDQRPVVNAGSPWTLAIFPRGGMAPTGPQQVNIKVEFMHKASWNTVKVASKSFKLKKGKSRGVKATLTAPAAAGTYFGGIRVSNGSTTTTVPVSIRVPVKINGGTGTFSGHLSGSTVEYNGGEFYFYDFTVPSGTSSISAQLTWPDQGNLINVYLVDPQGHVRDAKSGDLYTLDYSGPPFGVPDSALTHTAEQIVWDAPASGKWQVIVWAPGFSGNGFSEPYSGRITLNRTALSPAAWTATAAPGQTVTADFTVANAGPTDLAAYAESQASYNGTKLFDDYAMDPFDGTLSPDLDGYLTAGDFWLPQNTSLVTAIARWTSATDTLVDLGLYDPTGTSAAAGLATTSLGSSVQVENPMAGDWTLSVGYGDPTAATTPVDFEILVDFVAPIPVDGMSTSAAWDSPVTVPQAGHATISASLTVPADAKPGDAITGTLDFYTQDNQVQTAGGDHLGSVPVTITVAAAP